MEIVRVVSGGQTGADRAALDVAVALGLPYGGWCPRGGSAEDGPVLGRYPALRETESADPAERTRLNVRDSDATLVVAPARIVSPGTELTVECAARLGRPALVSLDPAEVRSWLGSVDGGVLNVAGPRASEWPEGYAVTRRLLLDVLGDRET